MSDQEFQFTDAPPSVDGGSAPDKGPKPYSDMGWEEYARTTLKNTPGDFWQTLTALPKALYHYDETGKALYGLGSGIISKLSDVPLVATYDNAGKENRVVPSVREIAGSPRTPEEKSATEAPLNATVNALVEPLSSKEAALRAIAEHPVGTLSTLSIPVTGGATAAIKGAEALGELSTIGRAISNVAKPAKVVGQMMDPTNAAIKGAEVAHGVAKKSIPALQAATTGAPYSSFSKALEAGSAAGQAGEQARANFMSYLKGTGSAADFSKSVNDAFAAFKKAETDKWVAEKGALTGAATQPISFDPVLRKFDELRNYYGGNTPVSVHAHADASKALDEAQNAVMSYAISKNAADHTITGFDKLKQSLYDLAKKQGSPEGERAVMGVWQSVRDQIASTAPEYDALMTGYQDLQAQLKDFNKTLGAGSSNVSQNAQLAKVLRAAKTPQKQQLLDKLVEIDPSIAYKVAGASLHDLAPTGFAQRLVEAGSAIPWGWSAITAITSGHPVAGGLAAAGAGAQAMAQSPKFLAQSNYLAGNAERIAGPAVKGVSKAAGVAAPIAVTVQNAKERAASKPEFSDEPFEFTDSPGASGGLSTGGRIARKSGGRIKTHPISAEVKRVRSLLSHKTATMLSMPDDAVATALHIAKGPQ